MEFLSKKTTSPVKLKDGQPVLGARMASACDFAPSTQITSFLGKEAVSRILRPHQLEGKSIACEGVAPAQDQRETEADDISRQALRNLEIRYPSQQSEGEDSSLGSEPSRIPPQLRRKLESNFDHDFSHVLLHTGLAASNSARSLGADAFTYCNHVLFGQDRYAPNTAKGIRLLGHELAHVIQHDRGVARDLIYCSPAGALIEKFDVSPLGVSLSLDEEGLGRHLLSSALSGDMDIVHAVIDELDGWVGANQDDVALEFVRQATREQLGTLSETEGGRHLIDALFDEMTAGHQGGTELKMAQRLLEVKAQRLSPADLPSVDEIPIFPFHSGYIGNTALEAHVNDDGSVWVKMGFFVFADEDYRDEVQTLPTDLFLSGITLPADTLIGVKLYDEGGTVVYRPPLFLVQLAHQGDTDTLTRIAETTAIAATLGSGALAAGAAEGTLATRGLISLGVNAERAATVLLWLDRFAFALETASIIIRENRGWIIEVGGENGKRFLKVWDYVQSVVILYGLGRAAVEGVDMVLSLKDALQRWRAATNGLDDVRVEEVLQHTDEVLESFDETAAAAGRGNGPGADTELLASTPDMDAPTAGPESPSTAQTPGVVLQPVSPITQATEELVRAQARGGEITVNIGGRGEYPDAINLNPNTTSAYSNPTWPNRVDAPGEIIGDLFPAESLDLVFSSKLPSGAVDWDRIAEGAFRSLKPGGRVKLNQLGLQTGIPEALRRAGFQNIQVFADTLVTATK